MRGRDPPFQNLQVRGALRLPHQEPRGYKEIGFGRRQGQASGHFRYEQRNRQGGVQKRRGAGRVQRRGL